MVSSMPKSRPPYPEEFRRAAVQMVRGGRTIPDVAGALGVTEQSLRTWVKRDQLERRERDDGLTVAERDELRELRRQVKRLERERESSSRSSTPRACPRPRAPEKRQQGQRLKTLRVSNTNNDYYNDND
jgi:transposase